MNSSSGSGGAPRESETVPMGVLAAWRHGKWVDYLVMTFSVLGFSVPDFVVGYILAYVFALQLNWLPAMGWPGTTAPSRLPAG